MLLAALITGLVAAPCPSLDAIEGEPQLVAEISALLEQTSDCPIVAVRVERDQADYRIELRDRWGRSASRRAKTMGTVAAFIAAWSEQEVVERAPLPPPRPPAPPATARLLPIEVSTTPPPAEKEPTAALVSADFELGTSPAIGLEVSGRAGACGRVAWACVGGSVRYGRVDDDHAVELLLDASAPFTFGRATFAPVLRVGVGYAEPTAFSGLDILWRTDWSFAHHLGPRLEGGLTASVRLIENVHVQAGASAGLIATTHAGLEAESFILRVHTGFLWGRP